jgi:hypothetical protein
MTARINNPDLEAVRLDIRKDLNNYADDMANGVCRSYDEYRELCGVIRGLALAESYLYARAQKVEESDDDDTD